MPYFDHDISVRDFLSECSPYDIKQIVEYLKRNNYINSELINLIDKTDLITADWNTTIRKLATAQINLTVEEEQIIKQIASKL